MIRCIAFDVVGTLLFADPPVHMAYHRIGRKFGSQLDPESVRQKFRDAMSCREGAAGGSRATFSEFHGDDWHPSTEAAAHVTSEEAEPAILAGCCRRRLA